MNKCTGCGVVIQSEDKEKLGYLNPNGKQDSLCERCFRIKNYNDYKLVTKDNDEFNQIIDKISKTNDLVILVIDIFTMDDLAKFNHLTNPILLVLTKRDLFPKDIYEEKISNYLETNLNIVDKVIISSKNNYQFDVLFDKIDDYKTSNNIYVVGFTNAGKSTMINKLIYNYSNLNYEITTSPLPSTTLDLIPIKLNEELTIIDTPGIILEGNIINYIDSKLLKKVIPNKEIKPISYQIRSNQIIIVDELLRIETTNNNLILYFSNSLKIERYYKNINTLLNKQKHVINVTKPCDIVILGLGFIKVMKRGTVILYTIPDIKVYTRDSLF